MKDQLLSFARHIITFIAGLGTLLAANNLIAPESAAAVDAAGAALVDPLSIVLGALAAGAVRMVMAWIAAKRISATGTGGNMVQAWALLVGLAGLSGFGLPACSPGSADNMPPIHASFHKDGITLGYSSKGGILLNVDQSSGK
jgi:hypothetical protein